MFNYFKVDKTTNTISKMSCKLCKETIWDLEERMSGLNFDIHKECFKCQLQECGSSLTSTNYKLKNDLFYCKFHFDSSKNSIICCNICERKISPKEPKKQGIKEMIHEDCFKCSCCKIPLKIESCGKIEGKLYCHQDLKKIFGINP
jgi:hypothetical protein